MATAALVAALVSTSFISLAPNLLLIFFPSFAEDTDSPWLLWGQALAAGGLLGDVFLHTLGHDVADDAGVWVLFGFVVFLLVDLVIQSLEAGSHGHDHHEAAQSNGTTKKSSTTEIKPSLLSSAVLLNLTADALHNFTDGLAIGASYAAVPAGATDVASMLSSSGGLIATISILLHEIPHELGDYAILIQHGFTKWQAIGAQFGTAIAAMTGAVMGVYAVQLHETAVTYATAGGFLYLACVTILPNVLAAVSQDRKAGLMAKLAVVIAFGTGIAFLYAVHTLEDDHHHGGGHSHAHHHHHHSMMVSSDSAHGHRHHEHAHDHRDGTTGVASMIDKEHDHHHSHAHVHTEHSNHHHEEVDHHEEKEHLVESAHDDHERHEHQDAGHHHHHEEHHHEHHHHHDTSNDGENSHSHDHSHGATDEL